MKTTKKHLEKKHFYFNHDHNCSFMDFYFQSNLLKMKKIPQPQSQRQEVLYELIKRINIDRRQMMLSCGVLNLPDQIMHLRNRYGLKINLTKLKTKNKFDREVEFGQYTLTEKKEASKIYLKMQQDQIQRENERNNS